MALDYGGKVRREPTEWVIRSYDDLEILLTQPTWRLHPANVRFFIEIPGLQSEDRSQFERQLSRSYSDCGCSLGTAAGLVSLVAYLGAIFAGTWHDMGWALWPIGILLVISSVGIGKVVGLAWAGRTSRRIIRNIIEKKARIAGGI
ncbi:MAG: hypothetical protein IH872_12075 [Chloroflexi bacterium]|nr:hypothetical protein [Chloroflexota bacterium]